MTYTQALCTILAQTAAILAALRVINRKLNNMATKQDLDNALAQLAPALSDLGTDINALKTAIDNLPKPGSDDFTPEIQAVTDAMTSLAASKSTVDAAIAEIQPPPPPPGP